MKKSLIALVLAALEPQMRGFEIKPARVAI